MRLSARYYVHGTKMVWWESHESQTKGQHVDESLQNQAKQSRKGGGSTQELRHKGRWKCGGGRGVTKEGFLEEVASGNTIGSVSCKF